MTTNYLISDLKKNKLILESDILKLISNFNESHGVAVNSVNLENMEVGCMSENRKQIIGVEIKVVI